MSVRRPLDRNSTYQRFCAVLALMVALLPACSSKVADLSAGQAAVSGVKIISKTIPGLQIGPVQTGISTAGGVQPLVFSIADGELPPGLILDSQTGQISGKIPTSAANQTYTPTIKVTDSAGLSDVKIFNCKIDPGDALLTIVSTELSALTAGIAYSFPVAVVGGTTPYKFSIATGSLPTGLSLDESTGIISGTPAMTTGGQSYVIALKVTDAASQVRTASFVGQISASSVGGVKIVSTSIPGIAVGSVSTGISTAGGSTPLQFTISSGSLPSGLTIDAATGSISGIIPVSAANSSFAFSVTVNDSSGSSATRSFAGTINAGGSVLSLLTTNLSTMAAGISYNFPLAVTGGTSPYTFSLASGALPNGVSIDSSTGIISGTPGINTGGQAYSVSIRVTDSNMQSQTNSFVGTIASNPVGAIQIVSTTIPGIAVGSVSTGISTSGGITPLVFSVSSGTLPTGLTLNSTTGAITGTIPVGSGNSNYGFSIAVADAAGATASRSFSGTVNPGSALLSLITSAISPVTAGISYSFPVAVSGGATPYAFAITAGSLPSGLTINPTTGVISGTPAINSGGQPYSFTLRVSDTASQAQSVALVGTIASNPVGGVQIVSTTIPGIAVGAVATGVSTSGGVTPLTFSVSSGSLPSGLSINSTTGAITGNVPIGQGNTTYGFSIRVVDAAGATDNKSFTGTVNAGSSVLSILSTQLSPMTAGVAYSFPPTVSGGTTPYAFTISAGSLPAGININATTGVLSGTPAVTSGGQAYSFTLRVADNASQVVTQQYIGTIQSNPVGSVQIVSTTIPGLTVGPVSTGISTAGGITPLTFAVTSGTLPTGLTLNTSTGAISGTLPVASANASYGFSISVTDASGASAVRPFTGTINAGSSLLTINSTTLSQFIAGVSYSYPLVVTGGTSPYTFAISSGSLPSGVNINPSSGTLSGTPSVTTAGQSFAFTVTTTDAGNQTASKTYTATVASSTAASLVIASTTIPAPTAGTPYVAAISVSGGTPNYTYTLSSGSLPTGLTLSASSGLITGTPLHATKGSAFLFTVQVTDTTNLTTSASYQGFVGTYTTTISPATLPAAIPSANYNGFISTTGGQAPYIYSLTSGALPSGLTLNAATGVISGTVSESEAGITRNFTILSVDVNNVQTSSAYALTTNNFSVSITNSTLANAIEGSAYSNGSSAISATGGTGPYSFQYSGNLPSGIGLTSSGTFFGTAATNSGTLSPGTDYTIYVRARDANNNLSATKALTLTTLVSAPSVGSPQPAAAVLGSAYSHSLTASGGRAPYSFAVTAGSLPAGLSLAASGVISGIASAANTCPTGQFTVRVTDSLSQISAASVKCIETVNGVLISNTALPMVSIGVNYSAQINASGGTTPYSYVATGLPSGITINPSTGALSGFTNASSGDYTAYFTATDSSTPTALTTTRALTVAVRNQFSLTASTLARAATGVSYNNGSGVQLNATGGYSPHTYAISSGRLPSGLTLTSSGRIQGTPAYNTAVGGGTYNFSVIATDALGNQTSPAAYTLSVSIPPKIIDSALPLAVVGTPYAYDIRRTGGVNQFNGSSATTRLSYSASVSSPAATTLAGIGLSIGSTTGRIFGTPTTAGTYTLAVSLTDQHGFVASRNMTLTVNTSGKRLDLKTNRWSDPCMGQSNCLPQAHDIAKMTNTSQQFLVYSRADTTPMSIQIAKIDHEGRIPLAGANVTSINVPLPANIQRVTTMPNTVQSLIGNVRIADLDQDTFKDIVFSDTGNRQICVLWNGGTVDTFGMPNGFSASNISCFPIPQGSSNQNYIYSFIIKDDLRPDSTNSGKQDIVVTSTSNIGGQSSNIFVLLNSCAPVPGNCSAIRHTIFQGYNSQLVSTTNASTNITLANTSGALPGATIVGVGIPAGAFISNVSNNTSITLSAAATATASNVRVTWPSATVVSGSGTFNNRTITSVANLGSPAIRIGQLVIGSGITLGTRISNITGSGPFTITLSQNYTGATGTVTFGTYQTIHHTPMIPNTNGTTTNAPSLAAGTTYIISSLGTSDFTLAGAPSNTLGTIFTATGTTTGSGVAIPVWGIGSALNIATGWFTGPKPSIPTGVTSAAACPGIIISGVPTGNTALGYAYLVRQTFSAGQCQGDFTLHQTVAPFSDLMQLVDSGTPYVSSLVAADFNNDGWSDVAAGLSNAYTNSSVIRVYTNAASGNALTGGTGTFAQLQSRGAQTSAASKLIPYCINGSNSCDYPALVATCGREYHWSWAGVPAPLPYSCLSILPNQCTSSGCSTPFEASTPTLRIDYPAPHGQNREPIALPLVSTSFVTPTATTYAGSATIDVSTTSNIFVGQTVTGTNIPNFAYVTAVNIGASTITINQNALAASDPNAVRLSIPVPPNRNDIAFVGNDTSTGNNPYFAVYARNGSSSTDPLKGSTMFDSFPSSFLSLADISSTRFGDANGDGVLDMFAYSPNQSFVGSYVSSQSGGTTYSIATNPSPDYLSNPGSGGCPPGATNCFPDPYFNSIGLQQQYPDTYPSTTTTGVPNQNIMDIGDLDNDGIPDIIVTGFQSRGIAVALGGSSGDLNTPALYELGVGQDIRPKSLATADLDQDGILDVVVVGYNVTSSQTPVAVWLKGAGDGTFSSAERIDQILSGCNVPRSIQAIDIDLDGRPELATLCYTNQAVWISRRHTDSNWIPQTGSSINASTPGANGVAMKFGRLTTSGASGVDMAVGGLDVNNSMRIINNISLTVTNTSTGSFSLSVGTVGSYIQLNGFVGDLDIGDLNGDGYGDIVASMTRFIGTTNLGQSFYTCTSTVAGQCNRLLWGGGEGVDSTSISATDINNDGLSEVFPAFKTDRIMFRTLGRILNLSQ